MSNNKKYWKNLAELNSANNDVGRLNLSFPRSRTHISPSSKFELNAQISFADGKPISLHGFF